MTVKVVVRKGNSAINSAYTGEVAELTYDSDSRTLRVHDGNTAGGTRAVTTNANGTIVSTNTISIANLSSIFLAANTANIVTATINTSSISNLNVTAANISNLSANSIGATLITAAAVTISGGTINQTQIGLTTPNTAAFTSVTVVNEPTSNTQLTNKLYVDRKVRLAIALSGV